MQIFLKRGELQILHKFTLSYLKVRNFFKNLRNCSKLHKITKKVTKLIQGRVKLQTVAQR